MWERLFFTEKCQLIKVGGMIELEKHHLATTSVIFDSAKVIHGCRNHCVKSCWGTKYIHSYQSSTLEIID